MEKQLVRETKYRHVHSKTWRKEVSVWNVKAGNESLIKTNGTYWAVPWASVGGGSLAVFPVSKVGKLPDNPTVLSAHPDAVLDYDFSPVDPGLLVTGSREATLKIWRLPGENEIDKYLSQKPPPSATSTLAGHTKRPALLQFHPIASDLLLTTSFDCTAKIWDLETSQAAISMQIGENPVTTLSWSPDGKLVASGISKDKKMGLYDPRSAKPLLKEVIPHEGGTKGFQVCFIEGNKLVTVGFSAKSERQLAVWDCNNFSKPLSIQTIDVDSSLLSPYYDSATGLLYLCGRGASIQYYELNNEAPYGHFINKATMNGTYSAVALVPRRFYDVTQCEVARFLKLGSGSVETVSFYVPRKTSWFQEDLYPPAPSGLPGQTGKEWLSGKSAPANTKSLKPEGMVSIYDVPEEEGGKNRELEEIKRSEKAGQENVAAGTKMTKIKEGYLKWITKGYFLTSWYDRWVTIKHDVIHVFPSEESPAAQFSIPISLVKDVEIDSAFPTRFLVTTVHNNTYLFDAVDAATRNNWKFTILEAKKKLVEKDIKSKSDHHDSASKDEEPPEGWMMIQTMGWLFESWQRRWFVLKEGNILYSYPSKDTTKVHFVDNFHLDRAIAISKTNDIYNQQHTFKICTLNQVVHFATETAEERDKWVSKLEFFRKKQQIANEFGEKVVASLSSDAFEGTASMESYLFKKGFGILGFGGRWQRFWVVAVGKDIIYYRSHTDRKAMERASLSMISIVAPSRGNDKEFELRLNDGTIVHHLAESADERDKWIAFLENKRRQFLDLLHVLGIDESKLESPTDIEKEPNFIDPTEVKNGNQKLLIQVIGKRRIRTIMVPLSPKSLNSYAAYVLDAGMKIYQWNGNKASRVTKAKAMDVATKIRMKERGGKATLVTIDQPKSDKADSSDAEFWQLLGGKIKSSEIREDEDIATDKPVISRLYLVVPKDEERLKARVRMIHETSPPPKEMLETDNVYVLDTDTEIFIWIGKASKAKERKLAINIAKKLSLPLEPNGTKKFITKVFENGETILFKDKFLNYPGMLPISTQKEVVISNIAQTQIQEKIEVEPLHNAVRPEQESIDDGSGQAKIWIIEGFEKKEIDPEEYGRFFSGDSYIILYNFKRMNKECAVIYFWQGRDSTRNEKGTSAYLTIDLNEKLGSQVQHQIRVVQNKEQQHFLNLFKNNLITFNGKQRPLNNIKKGLFEVIGDEHVRVQEVEMHAKFLNTLHSYIVYTPDVIYVWHGRFSSEVERKAAVEYAGKLPIKAKIDEVPEGEESDAFWKLLEGDGPETSYIGNGTAVSSDIKKRYPVGFPKAYLCSNASGTVKVERIFDFVQEDLLLYREHIIILDTFYEVYVWISSGSYAIERKLGMECAIEYIAKSKLHAPTTPIWVIYPNQEPLGFTGFVSGWNTSAVPKDKDHKKIPVNDVLKDYTREFYTIDELRQDPLPVGVDPKKLETYLSDKDFETVFKMSREEFLKLPKWRADNLKNEVGLV